MPASTLRRPRSRSAVAVGALGGAGAAVLGLVAWHALTAAVFGAASAGPWTLVGMRLGGAAVGAAAALLAEPIGYRLGRVLGATIAAATPPRAAFAPADVATPARLARLRPGLN